MDDTPVDPFEQGVWAILELMGHLRLAGRITEEERFGGKIGRIDIPGPNGTFVTKYFNGQSIYCLTPTTEATARLVAGQSEVRPVHPWELRLPAPATTANDLDEEESEG